MDRRSSNGSRPSSGNVPRAMDEISQLSSRSARSTEGFRSHKEYREAVYTGVWNGQAPNTARSTGVPFSPWAGQNTPTEDQHSYRAGMMKKVATVRDDPSTFAQRRHFQAREVFSRQGEQVEARPYHNQTGITQKHQYSDVLCRKPFFDKSLKCQADTAGVPSQMEKNVMNHVQPHGRDGSLHAIINNIEPDVTAYSRPEIKRALASRCAGTGARAIGFKQEMMNNPENGHDQHFPQGKKCVKEMDAKFHGSTDKEPMFFTHKTKRHGYNNNNVTLLITDSRRQGGKAKSELSHLSTSNLEGSAAQVKQVLKYSPRPRAPTTNSA